MILKNTLGLVIASMVLVSCSQVPLEHREPYAVVEVNKPAKEVYERAVAGAECNTVIELKPEHHAALPWNFA